MDKKKLKEELHQYIDNLEDETAAEIDGLKNKFGQIIFARHFCKHNEKAISK
jgi:hypothetical protein